MAVTGSACGALLAGAIWKPTSLGPHRSATITILNLCAWLIAIAGFLAFIGILILAVFHSGNKAPREVLHTTAFSLRIMLALTPLGVALRDWANRLEVVDLEGLSVLGNLDGEPESAAEDDEARDGDSDHKGIA